MSPRFLRLVQWTRWGMLLPLSLLAGCRLAEPPIYPRLSLAASVQPVRVLFIGNSLTYYNDLPGLVQQLSIREDHPLQIDSVTVANASLDFHWNNSAARKHLDRGGWDYVVLQEYSSKPADNRPGTIADYRQWAGEVKRVGAQPVIFENWPHKGGEGQALFIRGTYQQVQQDIGGQIAPIGEAWLACQKQHPEIGLFVDEKHPTVAGTYLTACVLYKTLYHKPAAGLPTAIPGLKLDPQVATTLQQIADAAQLPR